eukprot:jgi/Botrbrau1/623/Bobra.0161s0014.3
MNEDLSSSSLSTRRDSTPQAEPLASRRTDEAEPANGNSQGCVQSATCLAVSLRRAGKYHAKRKKTKRVKEKREKKKKKKKKEKEKSKYDEGRGTKRKRRSRSREAKPVQLSQVFPYALPPLLQQGPGTIPRHSVLGLAIDMSLRLLHLIFC